MNNPPNNDAAVIGSCQINAANMVAKTGSKEQITATLDASNFACAFASSRNATALAKIPQYKVPNKVDADEKSMVFAG